MTTIYYEVILKSLASGKVVSKFIKDPNSEDWARGWALYSTREEAQAYADKLNEKEKRQGKNVRYTVRSASA